jgi:D-arabinose 1-dehydrogenase-like Zn-dependent alcohol dehydrogenase
MPQMKAVQVSKPGGRLELVNRPIPEPGRAQVRIKVEACGVCHSDVLVKDGLWPGLQYPRIPGHEIAGRVDTVGPDVANWKPGQRVGVGWHGGHCFTCDPCRRGDFILCQFEKSPPSASTAAMPNAWSPPPKPWPPSPRICPPPRPPRSSAPASPSTTPCAMPMRERGISSPSRASGGWDTWGIQYARQMGFHTIAIGRGGDKDPLAKKLGAHKYIDTDVNAAPEALQSLGGARVILATAPDAKSISALIDGLAPGGKLVVVGVAPEPLSISPLQIVLSRRSIQGWPSGTAKDSEDALRFSALAGVRPMIERYPLDKAAEAYDQMLSGRARFRVVLTIAS